MAKSSGLVSVSGFYRNPENDTYIELHVTPLEGDLDEFAKTVRESLAVYDRGLIDEGWTRDEAAQHYKDQLNEWTVPRGGRNKNLTREERIIAIFNIYWLEQRGYLKPDDHNGMLFQIVYSVDS